MCNDFLIKATQLKIPLIDNLDKKFQAIQEQQAAEKEKRARDRKRNKLATDGVSIM